ncbi:hypothetical protein LOTGIDRAFT_228982 [Lottia gigantea]|uniref:Caspase family p20 domain-containing protein n=1 Tax=Lottia gigantea TaxID=225164 RepID=V4A288_LOTGI|nr:hypothetical protein LOTGIDRAFT_228982 [Lottia gigantea]ESO89045.1 hypothetical protein LOTGIDRAFT_228982 [Lottia gigantea]
MNEDRDFDCFVLAISSHGEHLEKTVGDKTIVSDVIHCTDGYITTQNILQIFSDENCPGLTGKPRFCFIQACRGRQLDPGVLINNHNIDINYEYDKFGYHNKPFTNHIVTTPFPCMTDFLVMYATPPGYYAFRRMKEGSWFVLALAKVLRSACRDKCDINKLLRQVVKEVSYGYQSESNNYATDMKKQAPVIYSMLTKTVYMCPK